MDTRRERVRGHRCCRGEFGEIGCGVIAEVASGVGVSVGTVIWCPCRTPSPTKLLLRRHELSVMPRLLQLPTTTAITHRQQSLPTPHPPLQLRPQASRCAHRHPWTPCPLNTIRVHLFHAQTTPRPSKTSKPRVAASSIEISSISTTAIAVAPAVRRRRRCDSVGWGRRHGRPGSV